MSLTNDYLRYLAELCAGSRPAPEGIALTETDDMKRALQLQEAVGKMGLTAFLKACAAQDGVCYTQQELDSFDEQALMKTIAQLAAQETQPETDVAGQTPVRSEIREIYEVFLDSVLLDDALLRYLIDICRRHDEKEFRTLSHAAARTLLDLDDFMAWLGSKELFAGEDERACVRILDACFARLQAEGKLELLAALLSGDDQAAQKQRQENGADADAPGLPRLHHPALGETDQGRLCFVVMHYASSFPPTLVIIRPISSFVTARPSTMPDTLPPQRTRIRSQSSSSTSRSSPT